MSTKSNFFYLLMRILNYREINDKRFFAEVQTGKHPVAGAKPFPTKKVVGKCDVETSEVLGNKVFTIRPRSGQNSRVILYLHGGAYLRRAAKQHWDFVFILVNRLGYEVVFPDYPVAPENSWKEVFEMTEAVYRDLTGNYDAGNIILMGDSAGGGLALALAQKMRENQIQQPGNIILLSPWLDLSMSNPEIRETEKNDPFLMPGGLKAAGQAYAKDLTIINPLVSPIYGDFHGLGRLTLFTGTYDILNPDARKLKGICDQKGIPVNYFEYPKMIHVWMILGFPESDQAIAQIDEIILNH